MNYKIVVVDGEYLFSLMNELEDKVNSLMAQGYKPIGSVSIATRKVGYDTMYTACQAIIKEE